jgi:transcription antitermination factor NusG
MLQGIVFGGDKVPRGAQIRNPAQIPEPGLQTPRWYACYTRARHEKRVAELLTERGVEVYLPLVPLERRWKDRMKVVSFPMFASYVFGRFTLADAHRVLAVPGVTTLVRANGRPVPIPDDELENVRLFADKLATGELETKPVPELQNGQWVRVEDGPLAGVVGIVVSRRGRRRVVVGLRSIGQGLEVDVRTALLTPIAAPGEGPRRES